MSPNEGRLEASEPPDSGHRVRLGMGASTPAALLEAPNLWCSELFISSDCVDAVVEASDNGKLVPDSMPLG